MEQRVSLITLGVADVRRARQCYERLGWHGQEVEETVFFRARGLVLVLWGRSKLAADSGVLDDQGDSSGGVALAHDVRSRAEVDAVLSDAERGASATRTVMCGRSRTTPGFALDEDGAVVLPDVGLA